MRIFALNRGSGCRETSASGATSSATLVILDHAMTGMLFKASPAIVAFVMVVLSMSCMPSWGNIITDYTVVRSEGCRSSFGGRIDDAELERVLGFRGSFNAAAWIRRKLVPQDEYSAQSLDEMGEEHALWVFSDALVDRDGFCYAVDQNRLCYETDLIEAIDLYRSYLVLKDPDDGVIWSTTVPFMRVPIYPYMVDHYAIYIGGKSLLSSQIVIVDLERGKVVDRWRIPGWDDFAMMTPVETYPFFKDGCIVVQGSKATYPRPNSGEEFRYVPQEIYVVKTRIESTDD